MGSFFRVLGVTYTALDDMGIFLQLGAYWMDIVEAMIIVCDMVDVENVLLKMSC